MRVDEGRGRTCMEYGTIVRIHLLKFLVPVVTLPWGGKVWRVITDHLFRHLSKNWTWNNTWQQSSTPISLESCDANFCITNLAYIWTCTHAYYQNALMCWFFVYTEVLHTLEPKFNFKKSILTHIWKQSPVWATITNTFSSAFVTTTTTNTTAKVHISHTHHRYISLSLLLLY